MKQNEPTFPVAGYEVRTLPLFDAILIRLDFLTHESQRPDEAHRGRMYALQSGRCRELVAAIEQALRALERSGAHGTDGPQH